MSKENLTITMSQINNKHGHFTIHLNDKKRDAKYFLMYIHFSESIIIDDMFMDEIISLIANTTAKKILKEGILDENNQFNMINETKAKEIVRQAIKKMRHTD